MLRLRRTDHELRLEMTPLMDVIFLLLTFFIYAMVLMVRAELLPVKMQQFVSGEPATGTPAPAATLTIDARGELFLNRQPIAIDEVIERLKVIKREQPETVIYLAAEALGEVDRLPQFLSLYDRLSFAGLDFKLVGAPGDGPAPGAGATTRGEAN
jgi:biopolymer transport protein ExbD